MEFHESSIRSLDCLSRHASNLGFRTWLRSFQRRRPIFSFVILMLVAGITGCQYGETDITICHVIKKGFTMTQGADFLLVTHAKTNPKDLPTVFQLQYGDSLWVNQIDRTVVIGQPLVRRCERMLEEAGFWSWASPPKGDWYDVGEELLLVKTGHKVHTVRLFDLPDFVFRPDDPAGRPESEREFMLKFRTLVNRLKSAALESGGSHQ